MSLWNCSRWTISAGLGADVVRIAWILKWDKKVECRESASFGLLLVRVGSLRE